ncbi:Na+:solute symporter [Rhodocaloribacter litoris]|uniref:sodium:solute symporter family protein n=1 Tax=Rhodocaloribacter litoris TaxID=2558931 RepID=UPI001E4612E1|nr:sodium:solute symporter family protein [Rhodocaloribacter litoris]QXD16316.1 Na+:solute symporter [Rhodocaloribacter litoris]
MQLGTIDWVIMAAFFALSLGIGLAVSGRSGRNFSSFFLAGRDMPWWLLGVSMVATTFSTDTPNLVTDLVRTHGIFGNWTWWAFLLTGMLTVFLYAKLWRRSEVLTDVEFYEIRYSGRLAAFLRGFRAVYLGIVFNILIMASVTLAAIKIGGVMMGWTPVETVVVAATVTMIYSALGGLRGVVLTDLVQFALAMAGSIGAAIYVLNMPEVGGLGNLLAHENVRGALAFWPSFETMTWQEMLPVFVIPLAVQWWAAYYPGSEPGGGGYVVQRMLSARNERHAVGATLLFNALHYALRPWPWILVALASLVVFPELSMMAERFPSLSDQVIRNDLGYPAMLSFLPSGLLGLVVTSLAAAYMSTMSTQVNWGSSIVVNDVYYRFINPQATERQQVWVGRLATVVLMGVACTLALFLENALQVFNIVVQIGAGTGLLFILRWFWWRINAASELTAMVVSFVVAVYFQVAGRLDWPGGSLADWERLLVIVAVTTAAWVAVAYLTPATDPAVLRDFYRRIRPGGPGWRPVLEAARQDGRPVPAAASDLPHGLAAAACGALGIYSVLFATGFFLYGRLGLGTFFALTAGVALFALLRLWPRLRFE